MSELYQCTFLHNVSWFFPPPKHTCDSEYEDVTGIQNYIVEIHKYLLCYRISLTINFFTLVLWWVTEYAG
jgi:hypothetical protein